MKTYKIIPVPACRMVQSDKWKNPRRPCVQRYFDFRDEVKRLKIKVDNGDSIRFILPMPDSWSKKKKAKLDGEGHMQTPDLDNLLKALLDAIMTQDKGIYYLSGLTKVWGKEGRIIID